jgi:rhodanese-related sulfurtransferase
MLAKKLQIKDSMKVAILNAPREKMQAQDVFYLIDVREESEWNAGYLPQALHLSKGILERDIERFLPLVNTPIILYCNGGYRSCLAADNLQKMGYTNVSSLIGGFSAWIAAGFPLSSQFFT